MLLKKLVFCSLCTILCTCTSKGFSRKTINFYMSVRNNFKMNYVRDRVDHFDYQKMPQSEGKVREISKPVKIAQLFGPPKQLQSCKKDSAVKISQPERITPYIRNTSTQKKNTSTQKKNGANTINRLHHSERNVRRNLKFTETPPTMKKTKQTVRTSTNNLHNKPTMSAKSLQTQNRKSFILPPNSIKNVHVAQNRFKHSKSMFPHINQTRILTEKSVTKYPRISEGSENCSPFVEDTDAPVNNSLQAVKKISESYVDLQRDIDGCEYVTLSKKELVALTFNLKHLICKVKTQLPQQINVVLEDNKENKEDTNSSVKHSKPQQDGTRRRSARLLAKALKNSNVDNDSFVNLEHELNISSRPSVTLIMPHIDRTPVMTGCKDKKTARPR